MSHEEEQKINDYKAQYNSILGNIRDANEQHSVLLKENETLQNALRTSEEKLKQHGSEFQSIAEKRKEAEITLEKTLGKLSKAKEEIDNIITYQETQERNRLLPLKMEANELSNKIKEYKDLLVGLKQEVSELNSKIDRLEIATASAQKDYNEILLKRNNLLQKNEELVIKNSFLETEIHNNQKELDKAKIDLEKAWATLENPRKDLERREEITKNLKKELTVWHRRLKTHYEQTFPGRVFKVSLFEE